MKFEEIITVAGKPGLFRILKASKNGYIAENLDGSKKKLVLGNQHRVSFLQEISLYTNDAEGSVAISDLFQKIKDDNSLAVENPSDPSLDLYDSLSKILPEYDEERIYPSDLKKFFTWYNLLIKLNPEMDFKVEEKGAEPKEEEKDEN